MIRAGAIGFFLWVFLVGFGGGFACSRIHDSERVQRVITEYRAMKEEYQRKIMQLERLPGVWPEDRRRWKEELWTRP